MVTGRLRPRPGSGLQRKGWQRGLGHRCWEGRSRKHQRESQGYPVLDDVAIKMFTLMYRPRAERRQAG